MSDEQRFQRRASVLIFLSLLAALASGLCLAAAANFSFGILANPDSLITIGANGANLFRFGMLFDVFGYYLLLIPGILVLWKWLQPKNPQLVMLYTLCGFGYILVGALGAIILTAVGPSLIIQYTQANASERGALQIIFSSFLNAVYLGMWNPLEAILGGIWWIGIGSLLRSERPVLGTISILLGAGALLDAFGYIVELEPIFLFGVMWLVLFFYVWAACYGIELWRGSAFKEVVLQK